jgi:hypothetical protein
MLLNIKTGYNGLKRTPMPDIVILVACLHDLANVGTKFVLTDRHAYLQTAKFANDVSGLERVDWAILQERDFKRDPNDPGKFERYQAEALIYQHLPASALTCILCYGAQQRLRLEGLVAAAKCGINVFERPNCYF